MKEQIVLISGKKGSGKDTLADELEKLCEEKGIPTERVRFADILYEMHESLKSVALKYDIPWDEPIERVLLQWLGTEWGRSKDPDLWVNATKTKIKQLQASRVYGKDVKKVVYLITDARFPNEITCFPDAISVRLECPEEVRKERCKKWNELTKNHASETSLDEFAEQRKFSFVFQTDQSTPNFCANLIMQRI